MHVGILAGIIAILCVCLLVKAYRDGDFGSMSVGNFLSMTMITSALLWVIIIVFAMAIIDTGGKVHVVESKPYKILKVENDMIHAIDETDSVMVIKLPNEYSSKHKTLNIITGYKEFVGLKGFTETFYDTSE